MRKIRTPFPRSFDPLWRRFVGEMGMIVKTSCCEMIKSCLTLLQLLWRRTQTNHFKWHKAERWQQSEQKQCAVLLFCLFLYLFLLFGLIEVHLRFNLLHWWFENASRAAPWVQIHAFTVVLLVQTNGSVSDWPQTRHAVQHYMFSKTTGLWFYVFSIILTDSVLVCLRFMQLKNSTVVFSAV